MSVTLSSTLVILARYLAGEFDNREQAIAEPAWYVHLRLWQRPVPLFLEDGLTLFAEQANVIHLDQPYRQRLLRLRQTDEPEAPVQVQYYAFKDPTAVKGAGAQPDRLRALTLEEIDFLPGCLLNVTHQPETNTITALPMPDAECLFSYQGKQSQVQLGFAASSAMFESFDKGIDRETQKATWGAVLGPYRYTKRRTFADELTV